MQLISLFISAGCIVGADLIADHRCQVLIDIQQRNTTAQPGRYTPFLKQVLKCVMVRLTFWLTGLATTTITHADLSLLPDIGTYTPTLFTVTLNKTLLVKTLNTILIRLEKFWMKPRL